jgi:hypothetical protein
LYVKSVSIKNLRCFQKAHLDLQYPGLEQKQQLECPNINLLLGNNGTGKTSVLKAIALAALSPVMPQAGFLPYRLVRRTNTERPKEGNISAEVILHEQDLNSPNSKKTRTETMSMRLLSRGFDYDNLISGNVSSSGEEIGIWESMYDDKSPAFLVVGYGATRRVEEAKNFDMAAHQKSRLLRYRRVAGLFESQIALVPLSFWFTSFQKENPGRYKQVVNLINKLLPEGAIFAGEFIEDEYQFEVNGVKTPFDALSDGYRAYIGWIADLLYHVCMGAPKGAKLVENRGLVLVDEIDLHLHPEWQRSVIPTLSEVLPNLQFIFTTHSPIVAGSLRKENIFVMETESSGASTVHQYEERIYGLDAEEVLLSSYFGLTTTRAEPFANELRGLASKAGQGDLSSALSFMQKLSGEALPQSAKALLTNNGKSAARPVPRTNVIDSSGSAPISRVHKKSGKGTVSKSVGTSIGRAAKSKARADVVDEGVTVSGKKTTKTRTKKSGKKR